MIGVRKKTCIAMNFKKYCIVKRRAFKYHQRIEIDDIKVHTETDH